MVLIRGLEGIVQSGRAHVRDLTKDDFTLAENLKPGKDCSDEFGASRDRLLPGEGGEDCSRNAYEHAGHEQGVDRELKQPIFLDHALPSVQPGHRAESDCL